MKGDLKFILVVSGIFIVFFVMGREIVETRGKLRKTQDQIVQEKKENIWLRDELKATRVELAGNNKDLRNACNKLDFVNRKISALRHDNTALVSARHGLERRIAVLEEEKMVIEAKFHSLNELKKAIRQVKLEIRDDRIRQRGEWIKQQEEIEKWETARGNHGFLIKDGEYCYKPKVNVEVRPANISLNKK